MHATPKIICYGKKPYISGAIFDYCCGWKQDGTFLGVENIYQSLDWSQVYEFAFCFVDANNTSGYSDLHVTTGMKKDIDKLYDEDITLNNKADKAYYNTGIYLKGSSKLLGGYWFPDNGGYISSGDWKSTPKLICDGNKPYIEGAISNYFCGWKRDGTFLGIENRYQSLDWSQVYEFTHNFYIADNPAGFDNLKIVTEIGHTVIDMQDNVNVTHIGASQLLNGAWMPDTGSYNASQSGYKCTPKYKCNGIEPYIIGAKWKLLMRYDSNGDYIGFNDYGEVIDWESATWFSIDFETQENPNGFNNLVIICGLKGESKKHGNRISDLELKDFYSAIERMVKYWDAKLVVDGNRLRLDSFMTSLQDMIEFNEKTIKQFSQQILDGEHDTLTLYSTMWPLSIGKEEATIFLKNSDKTTNFATLF